MTGSHVYSVSCDLFAAIRDAAMRQVLVIAEEEVAGRAIVDMLAEVGHQGFQATDPQQAARLVALNPQLDVTVVQASCPSLDLWWLLDGLIQLRPRMVLVSSFDCPDAGGPVELPIDIELPRGWDAEDLFLALPPQGTHPGLRAEVVS